MEGEISAEQVRQYGVDLDAIFRRNLTHYRQQRRMKQLTLAQLVGYQDHSPISKIERGDMRALDARRRALALALRVPLAWLLWEPFPPPDPDQGWPRT